MNSGSSLLECMVALFLASAIACGAISSLLTAERLTQRLQVQQRLTEAVDVLDGLQASDPLRNRSELQAALAATAAFEGSPRCAVLRERPAVDCILAGQRRLVAVVMGGE